MAGDALSIDCSQILDNPEARRAKLNALSKSLEETNDSSLWIANEINFLYTHFGILFFLPVVYTIVYTEHIEV